MINRSSLEAAMKAALGLEAESGATDDDESPAALSPLPLPTDDGSRKQRRGRPPFPQHRPPADPAERTSRSVRMRGGP
jgi:hypothetical protein